jgi:hypothetical protein
MTNEEKKERNRATVARWRKAHPDQVKKWSRSYYLKHCERLKQRSKDHYKRISEKAAAYDQIMGDQAGEGDPFPPSPKS